MSDYSNQLYYHLGSLAFAGLVLSGEGINDARAQFYLSEAETLLNGHMIPAMNQEAGGDGELTRRSGFTGNGGWGEDMGHLDMTHPLFGRMVEAWRTGFNQDLFPSINGLAKYAQYMVYMRRPNGMLAPKGNSSYQTGMSDKNVGTLGCLLSARYNDPLGEVHQGPHLLPERRMAFTSWAPSCGATPRCRVRTWRRCRRRCTSRDRARW